MDNGGRTALLTGGTAGIRREIAQQMEAMGAHPVLAGRNPERLDKMRQTGPRRSKKTARKPIPA